MNAKHSLKTYCIVCKKDIENKNAEVFRTRNKKLTIISTCSLCNNKKSRFINKNEEFGILSNLGTRTPLNQIPLSNVLF